MARERCRHPGVWALAFALAFAPALSGCREEESRPEESPAQHGGVARAAAVSPEPPQAPPVNFAQPPAANPAGSASAPAPPVQPAPPPTPPDPPAPTPPTIEPPRPAAASQPDPVADLPTLPPPATQSATAPPRALEALPAPAPGQFAVYAVSAAGPRTRLKQTVEALGPGPNDVTVAEQMILDGEPLGPPRRWVLPRTGRRWPRPLRSDVRTVRYDRERLELDAGTFDCIVLTIESRSAGTLAVEKHWICPEVPVTHLARLVVTTDGREVMRRELVELGPRP